MLFQTLFYNLHCTFLNVRKVPMALPSLCERNMRFKRIAIRRGGHYVPLRENNSVAPLLQTYFLFNASLHEIFIRNSFNARISVYFEKV